MRITDSHPEVVIVGAGPSGLMMAAQLLRNGIQPVIIDAKLGPTSRSRALAVQARTMEIFRQMGLSGQIIKDGTHAGGMKFYELGTMTVQLEFKDAGRHQTPFPFVELYEQNKTERLLLNELTRLCCTIYWDTELTGLQQLPDAVQVQLSNNAQAYSVNCKWLIGADGGHSLVRRQLQIDFKGDTYPHCFYLADVQLRNEELNHHYMQLYLGKTGFAAFFPMPEQSHYRIAGNLPVVTDAENLQLGDVEGYLNTITGFKLQPVKCRWFTTYQLHHRMAGKFSLNRCFLIGDAAHIHSPVGGQGMNTGLQDAYNLAWKLAGVLKGQLGPDVLTTYAAERMPVAAQLLQTTDRIFNIVTAKNPLAGILKRWVLPNVLKRLWKSEGFRQRFFIRLSQTGIQYRNSKISLHLSRADHIKAGDRLPYLKIYDEKKQQETDLHAWCTKPGFTLITFGALQEQYIFTLARWITQSYGSYLNFFHMPPSIKNQHVFDRLEIKSGHVKAIIVRPDMHIGFMADTTDMEIINNYLRNTMGITGF